MSSVEDRIDAIAYDEAEEMYSGRGPDLLVKNAPLHGDFGTGQVDLFLYTHDNQDVKMIGVYEESVSERREEAREWLDFFFSKGFVNVRGTLKKAERESEYPGRDGRLEGDYLFAPETGEGKIQDIWDSLHDTLDVDRIIEDYELAQPENF